MAKKKVRVKVTKKKLNLKRVIITIFLLIAIFFIIKFLINRPITNIYITGSNYISDKEIINLLELEENPSFIKSFFTDYNDLAVSNKYIDKITIKHKIWGRIYIKIKEKKPLFIYEDKVVLSDGEKTTNKYNITNLPYIKNNIDKIYDKLTNKYLLIEDEVSHKISEIEYVPNNIDKERFLLTMTDENYVYITLSKIEKINKYNTIVSELQNKKGIIYLDSGDYIEIRD